MKNIQIIDRALNCAYDIFEMADDLYDYVFRNGRDIAFIEDFSGDATPEIDTLFERMWKRPVNKKKVNGIHGAIFYELTEKREFYSNRKEYDLDLTGRGFVMDEAGG